MRDHPHRQHLEACITAAQSDACQHAFTHLEEDEARLQLEHRLRQSHGARGRLEGLTVAVKDLFDIAGQITTAGSRVLLNSELAVPPAKEDAIAVQRLKREGALVLGRSNMTEFAFSGVGVNPHYGTPANPCDQITARIPGGSSSGSAVAVAAGAADIGLGTDTGGSLRIPAALCGIVGFKSSASLVPQQGCFPLSTSLDTVGAMTRSVAQAIAVHEVLSQQPITRSTAPLARYRIGIAEGLMLEGMDPEVERSWSRVCKIIRTQGDIAKQWETSLLKDLSHLQSPSPLVAAEAFALHRSWLASHADEYDPRVAQRIALGSAASAADYIKLTDARRRWIASMHSAIDQYDVMVSPTVPIVAPPIGELAPGADRDAAFFKANALLLRNTSVVNFLDGCAISIPCHVAGELPVGLMIWHRHGRDASVLNVAAQLEALLATDRSH